VEVEEKRENMSKSRSKKCSQIPRLPKKARKAKKKFPETTWRRKRVRGLQMGQFAKQKTNRVILKIE